MSKQSSLGSMATKLLAIAIVAFVAIFLFKAVLAAIAGVLQLFFTLALVVVAVLAVGWLLRKL